MFSQQNSQLIYICQFNLNDDHFSYKSEMNDVSVQTVAGSTLPLVQLPRDEESYDYNPYEHRKVAHPTT